MQNIATKEMALSTEIRFSLHAVAVALLALLGMWSCLVTSMYNITIENNLSLLILALLA